MPAQEMVSLNLKKQYYLNAHIHMVVGDSMASITKNAKGNVYIDNISIKGAQTLSVTFDKNDTFWMDAFYSSENEPKELKVSKAALP